MSRVESHPVLRVPDFDRITFYFADRPLAARRGEMISSALFANGIRTFGAHPKDQSPQGIFCANGQCSQCLVIADGLPVKACMAPVADGMKVYPLLNYPDLPPILAAGLTYQEIPDTACDLLIVGGGPAGMGAAIEAADAGLAVILADDKESLGGKLVLQTHLFFGAVEECYAGTRGVDIAAILAGEVARRPRIKVLTAATAVGCFVDGKVGIIAGDRYELISPRSLLVAAGAREKALLFPGCDLPGVYGAGAFQTLLNRDLVRPAEKLFVVGGGNVGLIAAYHALQAGITVVGICEALPDVGGYWVHADKIRRLGVPIHTSTTVVSANGSDRVESVTVAAVDRNWKIIPGSYRTFACDTLLIAVGLERVSELYDMARQCGIDCHLAGDAEEIAEASAAMFSGRLAGRRIARGQGRKVSIPEDWQAMTRTLKSKPGREDYRIVVNSGNGPVFPVIGCFESIPCNPCAAVCPQQSLHMPSAGDILPRAEFTGSCTGCAKCVAACPGLAITLVDLSRSETGLARVTIPFEVPVTFKPGDRVDVTGWKGEFLGTAAVVEIFDRLGHSPCRAVCPADVRAQAYIQFVRQNRLAEAVKVLRRDLPLPGVCGRVCYHPCEEECVRGDIDAAVAICALKRFAADWARQNKMKVDRNAVTKPQPVAVVGSGPAGLACAHELSFRGYATTVFETRAKAGGLLRYAIPAYRLPGEILDFELDWLIQEGIEIRTGTAVRTVDDIFAQGYAAVFIAPGASQASRAGIPGEDLAGVHDMMTLLEQARTGQISRLDGKVAVIGGGNSALDSAQTALRLGAREVRILYRRSREQMPAHDWEIKQAEAEGVNFDYLVAPVAFKGTAGRVRQVQLVRMKLGAPDASGRARPEPVPGSDFDLAVDHVVIAIGQQPGFDGLAGGLALTGQGFIAADPLTQETSRPGVFAGGDAVTGASTVVAAFGAGKRAAESIDRYLQGKDLRSGRAAAPAFRSPACVATAVKPAPRVPSPQVAAAERKGSFAEIVETYAPEAAAAEAARCLGCGALSECLPGAAVSGRAGATPATSPVEDHARLVVLAVDPGIAVKTASIRVQIPALTAPVATVLPSAGDDNVIICRCERVTVGAVRRLIRQGVTDLNQLKAVLHIGMGACGAKTCGPLLQALYRQEGVALAGVTPFVVRPLTTEVRFGAFAGLDPGAKKIP